MPRRSSLILTDKRVRSLKPKARDYEVSDARMPGFGVRISPYGLKTFFYRFHSKGSRRRKSLGLYGESGDLAKARREAEILRGLVLSGEDPASASPVRDSRQDRVTFGQVARRWIEEYAKVRKKTWRDNVRMLERDIYPHWDHTPIDSIRPSQVREVLQTIAKRSGVVANRTHAVVRTIFTWAIEADFIESNPAAIRQVFQEKAPKTVVADDDIVTLWSAWAGSGNLTGAALCLYLLTGLRHGELRNMKWSRYTDRRFEIPGEVTKNGMPHTVFLSRQALQIVEAVREVTGEHEWVFPSTADYLDSKPVGRFDPFVRVFREETGVENWSIMTLRRTASTILARQGVEPFVIDIFLNHVLGDVTHRHYVRYRYAEQAAEANQRLGDFVESLVGPIKIEIDGIDYGNRDDHRAHRRLAQA